MKLDNYFLEPPDAICTEDFNFGALRVQHKRVRLELTHNIPNRIAFHQNWRGSFA